MRLIEPEPERDCASVMVKGSDLDPGVVPFETVAVKVNVLPLPENDCAAEPPIDERSAVTAKLVLAGFVPGVMFTVSSVDAPGNTEFGFAVPVPVGFVDAPVTVSEMFPLDERDCASLTVKGSDFAPLVVALLTVELNEKILSPATASPLRPSSRKA